MEDSTTIASAINGPDEEGWKKAVNKEMSAIESFGTYFLQGTSHARVISSRIRLHIKVDPTAGENHLFYAIPE